MIRIVGVSHYFHRILDGASHPPLNERISAVVHERPRRIDRFVQLALLGAGECVAGRRLATDCGLYLSSGVGPIGSMVIVQDAIHRDGRLPTPFSFVNTLGGSACYHIAKELGLSGEAVLVARRGGSFLASLTCAIADLESGVVSQMLVGAVEECVLPGVRHRALIRRGRNVAIAEGSHWLLLEAGSVDGAVVEDIFLENADFDGYESRDAARITGYLVRHPDARGGLTWSAATRTALLTRS